MTQSALCRTMASMRRDFPSGTVTLLFTDIEGSTRLLEELGPEAYATELAEHRRRLREAFVGHAGVEVDTQGDAFFIAFPTAAGALEAAQDAQRALAAGPIRVRMGLHTGMPHLTGEGYVGQDVHKGARIAAAGHGGQVLLSKETQELTDADLQVTDLGEHRLKDFDRPVWIFQMGSERFPPLKTISNTNLPRPVSSFVGREREVSEVASLFRQGARLVTLTGPGGTGKTRLAIEAASELVPEHRNGVFWIALAGLRDPALVLDTIGQTLGAKDGLAEHIGEREMLLLLDNLEQVVVAAPDLAALVESCPNLRLLGTSRERLRVRGEVEYQVLPLAEPEAVRLFSARAGADPDDTIRELCRALDNLPLALELAAARATALSPKQILDRLSRRLDLLQGGRDADARQQTLRATIEWSYDLLSAEEQLLFARLSVFSGGWTLEAAEAVVEADLDTLQSLVDKSLVRFVDERYSMLETIRDFASERLQESDEAQDLRGRHGEYFLALAEEAEPHLPAYQREWIDRLDVEHDNLRAAFDRLESSGKAQLALRLAGALSLFWLEQGHMAEGRHRLEAALNADERPTAARAKALDGASMTAIDAGSKVHAEEGLALHRALGDAWGIAHSQLMLGSAVANDDMTKARELYDESARAFRALGDQHYALIATRGLAWACISVGERERGRELHEDNLRRARALGNRRIEAITLGALAMHAVQDGRMNDAIPMLLESHRLHLAIGDPLQSAFDLFRFSHVLAVKKKAEAAAQAFACSDSLCAEMGMRLRSWDPEFFDETMAMIRSQLDEAAFAEAWEKGRKLTVEAAVALALDSLDTLDSIG
jgi:predicted ATPase/class 3 adenylate cyclase